MTQKNILLAMFTAIACSAWGQALETDVVTKEKESDAGAAMVAKVHNKGRIDYKGEKVSYFIYQDMYIYPPLDLKTKKQQEAYNRLVRNVKKVLPYAQEAHQMLIETYEVLVQLPTKEAREEHMKIVEQEIKKTYTPKMKKLTFAQGKLLIKLVNRECNSSSYEIIQAFLGPVRAGFYQAFAWAFGASLKKGYDPEGADRITERVVRQVLAGQI